GLVVPGWPAGPLPRPAHGRRRAWRPTRAPPEARSARRYAPDPFALFLLPDRSLRLETVDDLPRPGEGLGTMRCGDCDGHRRLGQRHGAHPMLDRRRAQSVAFDGRGHDFSDLAFGHLGVGLVLQLLHLA